MSELERKITEAIRFIGVKSGVPEAVYGAMCLSVREALAEASPTEAGRSEWIKLCDDHLPAAGDFVLTLSHAGNVSLEQGSHVRFLWKDAKHEGESCYYAYWMVCPIPPKRESMNNGGKP